MKFDRKTFFDGYRSAFGDLNQSQVVGLEFLLGKLEADTFSLKQSAYVLSTIDHETAHTFQPIMERRERASSPRRKNQDRYWLTNYQGRGFIQITWDYNYEKFGIADEPDKALEPETAYKIVSKGMRNGMFTGKKLSDYITNGKADYKNSRKVVNGLDKADQIAANARKFEAILESAAEDEPVTEMPIAVVTPYYPTDEDKGVTIGTQPEGETAGTPPPAPAAEVKASESSWKTKLGSLSIPTGVGAVITGIGSFAGGLPPYAWFALAAIFIAAMVLAFLVWKTGKDEAHARTLRVLDAAADKNQNNLRLT